MSAKGGEAWYDKVIHSALGVSLALFLLFAVVVHISECGVHGPRREMRLKARCSRRLQDIAEACFLYQDEYGSMPASFGDLVSAGYTDPKGTQFRSKYAVRSDPPTEGAVFTVPGVGPEVTVRQEGGRFEVVGSPFTIVARSPIARTDHEPVVVARLKGWRAVFYSDNRVEWYAVEEGSKDGLGNRQ
jgi:hypothetical protein